VLQLVANTASASSAATWIRLMSSGSGRGCRCRRREEEKKEEELEEEEEEEKKKKKMEEAEEEEEEEEEDSRFSNFSLSATPLQI